jgi:predicted membrane protein
MRIIFYAILFYLVFLLLKVIFGKLVNTYKYKPVNKEQRPKSVYTKKDLKNIEDAEFEELK